MTEEKKTELTTRDENGRFIKGQSGNPAGRPVGTKNQIVQLKQDLELAVRQNIDNQDIHDIVSAMVKEAKLGNVSAAKLLLDKTVSNARDVEDPDAGSGGVRIVIENATLQVDVPGKPTIEGEKIIN